MALYLAEAAGLLRSPIARHPIVEGVVYSSVELIDVDGFEAGEKAPVSIVAKRSTRIISWSHVKLKTFSKTGLM
jgi:hypothetical protein